MNREADSVEQVKIVADALGTPCKYVVVENQAHSEQFTRSRDRKTRRSATVTNAATTASPASRLSDAKTPASLPPGALEARHQSRNKGRAATAQFHMATKITRQQDLLYHRATFLKKTDKTLQEHVNAASQKLGFASERAQKFGEDEDSVRLWNKRVNRGLLLCGMFHSYERGRSQLVIQVTEKSPSIRSWRLTRGTPKGRMAPRFPRKGEDCLVSGPFVRLLLWLRHRLQRYPRKSTQDSGRAGETTRLARASRPFYDRPFLRGEICEDRGARSKNRSAVFPRTPCQVKVTAGEFSDTFVNAKPLLRSADTACLVFLDQYGIKDVGKRSSSFLLDVHALTPSSLFRQLSLVGLAISRAFGNTSILESRKTRMKHIARSLITFANGFQRGATTTSPRSRLRKAATFTGWYSALDIRSAWRNFSESHGRRTNRTERQRRLRSGNDF